MQKIQRAIRSLWTSPWSSPLYKQQPLLSCVSQVLNSYPSALLQTNKTGRAELQGRKQSRAPVNGRKDPWSRDADRTVHLRSQRGKVPSGRGGPCGAGDRRPFHPSDDLPCMGPGPDLLRPPHLPQHLLHVPYPAARHFRHPHADRCATHRETDGQVSLKIFLPCSSHS